MEASQLQFFDRGRCARAARWISGHYFLSPFSDSPSAEVTRRSWRLLDEFSAFSVVVMTRNTWFQWMHILRQLLDGFGRIFDFTTWLVDSDPEVGSSFLLWPRLSLTTGAACFLLVLLVFLHLSCVPDDCRQEVAANVVVLGNGMFRRRLVGFAGDDAFRAVFPCLSAFLGRRGGGRSSSFLALVCVFLALLV